MRSPLHPEIIALIERSESILLCTHRKPDGDAVGSIMGLYKALTLLDKKVTATCADELPESFHFLPEVDQVSQQVTGGKDFVITLDCDKTEVDRLKYHLEDNKIHIMITPKEGRFLAENVSCSDNNAQFDLIITVDVADIPQLGRLYEDNVGLFTNTPVINIDHHVSNTEFGKINYVDVAASSTAEILYQLIRDMETHFNKPLIVADTATFLLSGVATDTGSFQNANTTPRAMEVAADLMDAGANQHDVVKYLFRTKKLSTLKLWGKILTKIEVDAKHRLVWSSITQQDLLAAGAKMEEAGDIIDELLVHAPEAEIVALFKEEADMVSVSLRSKSPQANVMEIAQQFNGGGHVQAAGIKFHGKRLPEVTNKVLVAIQEKQRQRLNLSAEEDVAAPGDQEVTQVLDGYTPATEVPVSPTLEERAETVVEKVPAAPAEVSTAPVPPAPLPAVPAVPATPSASSGSLATPSKPPGKLPEQDIHAQAKAAITAEQSQASEGSVAPSESAKTQVRPKPPQEKRFTKELPDFLKPASAPKPPLTNAKDDQAAPTNTAPIPPVPPAPATPVTPPPSAASTPTPPAPVTPPTPPPSAGSGPSAAPAAPADDGVSVSYGNTPAAVPEIPQGSSEPVVKNVSAGSPPVTNPMPAPAAPTNTAPIPPAAPAPATPTPPPAAPANPFMPPAAPSTTSTGSGLSATPGSAGPAATGQGGAQTGQQAGAQTGQQGAGTTGATNPPAPPKPEKPKDPFAIGDDGLTDIERALGGL